MNYPIRVSHDIFMQMDLIVSKTMNKWSHPIRSPLQFHPSGHIYLQELKRLGAIQSESSCQFLSSGLECSKDVKDWNPFLQDPHSDGPDY
jgi:hypothetical protein